MELENNKSNQLKSGLALTSTLALIGTGVGVSHNVSADEVASVEQPSRFNGEVTTSLPTTVEETKARLDAKNVSLTEQKASLVAVNDSMAKTSTDLEELENGLASKEKAVAEAEKILELVSNASQEEFDQLVEKNKAELAKTQEEVAKAELDKATLTSQVASQSQEVALASNEAKKMAEQAEQAEKKVTDLTNMVNQPEVIAAQLENAQNEIKQASEDLAKAKTNLQAVRETTKNQLTNDLASNQSSLAEKKAELAKVEAQTSNVTVNVMGANQMVAPDNYPIDQIKTLMASGYIGTQPYLNTFNSLKESLISNAQEGDRINKYVDIPTDLDRKVDPDHLPADVQNELALFAANLINSVRRQLGLSQVEVTQGAQDFARKLTESYKTTHGNTVPSFIYNQPDKNGHIGIGRHDKTLIVNAATSVGLKTNDDNMYENIGFFNDLHTVNGIKRSIYNSIKYMLFTDFTYGNTFGHTVNLLRSDKTNPDAPVYLGVSTETVGGLNTHYVIFPASNIVNSTLFNKTLVSGPTMTMDSSARINSLQTSIASIEAKIQSLQGRIADISAEAGVRSAQQTIDRLTGQLQTAHSTAEKAKAQLLYMERSKGDLKTQLSQAKVSQQRIQADLDATLIRLNQSKVLLHSLEGKQSQVLGQLTTLLSKKAELEKTVAFLTDPNREQIAKEKLQEAQKDLSETLLQIQAKKNLLNDLNLQKAKLSTNITTTEQEILLLTNHLADKLLKSKETSIASTKLMNSTRALTQEFMRRSAKAVVGNAQTLAKDVMTLAQEATPDQGVLAKVADGLKKNSEVSKKPYGASLSTVGKSASNQDESTKRAIGAAVVMLAVAGVTGYKLRRDGKK